MSFLPARWWHRCVCTLLLIPVCAFAQIPGIKIPELGIRTDPIKIEPPRADVVGDLTHPDRILRNADREIRNAGEAIDRARLEAMAQANAPALAAWLTQSRNDALRGGAIPIPLHIRQAFSGFYDDDVLNRARFKIGDNGAVNLANLSLTYGDRDAIVLIDVIVFKNLADANGNIALWAHELKHVQQYRDWGVHDFAIRYLRSWNGVENDADAAQASHQGWYAQRAPNGPGPLVGGRVVANPPMVASICMTSIGNCAMGVMIPVGAQCYCPSFNGPVWGVAR